jgi:hypothetical protein
VIRLALLQALLLSVFAFAQDAGSADRTVPSAATPPQQKIYVPLTQHERLHLYTKSLVSPTAVVSAAASAGIGQWRGTQDEWGQGGVGYGRRFASAFGGHIVRDTLIYGLSATLNEDNRYIPSGAETSKQRVKYAITSTFASRHNNGTRHISISKIAGFAGAALISRSWQPRDGNRLLTATTSLGISFSVAIGFNMAREFLPRLIH